MAGTDTSFDAEEFRTNIRSTMNMGLTNKTGGAPTFFVPPTVTYDPNAQLDANGEAFNWTATKTVNQPAGVQVPCAVTWASGESSAVTGRRMGDFEIADIVITILDVDYALVEGANRVKVDDTTYEIRYRQPSVGLFDVTVWTLHAYTANQE